ncbi:hypothetical protein BDN67DRAFT_985454 [Paxillus ammoniavirescens]|nr:hypothetical protein BDN67DRAFT_985454 [Paxillus ammoniavirescens]
MENFAWLTPEEEKTMVEYCLELAARGFPLNHKGLKHHVDAILRARLGETFPKSDHLGRYWSSPLDPSRGQAVNPNTHKTWCDLLEGTINKYNIVGGCLWAADETGFQPGGGQKERVIGPASRKIQHQQHDGNHETITVMVMICADGDSISPTVIYKGQSFLTNWHQESDDTLKAS